MANTFDGRIYRIDTATPVSPSGFQGAVTSDSVVVQKIRWVSATGAAATVRLTDINNNIFWETVASGAQYVEESNWMPGHPYSTRTLNGVRVVTLTSGVVYLYKE